MNSIKLIKIKKHEIFKAWLLQRKGFNETLKKYKDYKTSPATESFIRFIKKFTKQSTDNYWVISNNKITGAICIVSKSDCMWLGRFYILPEYRNKGIGQRALLLAENLYPNAKQWRLDTIFEEKNNVHLYQKLGYQEYGERKTVNDKMTLVKFEKNIE
ncbi:MAG: GNAT family N-acetyltransferase [Eubacterium sp.]|nr:GNAT family N-acetyltransferase [Eubacterium sp.]